jgi:hypothetical protein
MRKKNPYGPTFAQLFGGVADLVFAAVFPVRRLTVLTTGDTICL